VSTDLHESDDFLPSLTTESQESVEAYFDSIVGQVIGKFHIEKRLGAGAMAAIYRATDTQTGQPVALKLLNAAADEVLRTRFAMEARTVRTLHHPHIVEVFDAGQTAQGVPYIAMMLVDGEDLGTFLEKRHQLSVLDSCRILQPIAEALSYAHDSGVIHRDVKPGNILLSRVPVGTPNSIQLTDMAEALIPLLSDFGIARALDAPELTTLGRTIGTPAYMSPEQCAGHRLLDGRADIYSLGTVLYRCLVGRAPFVGATTQILHAHVYESILIPDNLSKALPPAMKAILQKTLQKEPEARYADASQLATDLGRMIQEIAPVDATLTMPSLPVTPPPSEQLTHVLVPGVMGKTRDATPSASIPALQAKRTGSGLAQPTTASPRATRARRAIPRQINWAALLLGILLSAGIGLVFFAFVINVAPRLSFFSSFYAATPATTPNVLAEGPRITPLVGNLPPDSNGMTSAVTSAPSALTNTAAITAAAVTAMVPIVVPSPNRPVSSTVTAAITTIPVTGVSGGVATSSAVPTVTVTASPPALLDVAATWDDVQYYYQNGDWGEARWNLITMLSAKDGIRDLALNNISPALQAQQIYRELTSNPTALYWRQWLDAFTVDEVSLTLADIYMGLANEDIVNASDLSTLAEQTADYLLAAAVGRPIGDTVRQLSAELSRYLLANEQQRVAQLDGLVSAYLAYAQEREAQGAHCVSFQALTAAHQLAGDRVPSDLLRQYETTCRNVVTAQTTAPADNPLNGTIYYSSEQDKRYTIWRVPVANPESVASVINNASQPSLLGNRLAFYSRRSDSEGLSGVELDHTVDPNDRFPRYTNNVEDARESPARWNPTGTLLVFSSTDGDRKDRLYTTPTTFSRVKDVVTEGEDPVWSPDGKYILYRDVGADGNMPGLVLRSFDTGQSQRLTHGDDRRPIWTSDGKYIIFMRDVGANNWELFRLTVDDDTIVRLTNDPAQDGLPSINPADNTIVFASDRGGKWNLWTISLFESEAVSAGEESTDIQSGQAQFLMPVQGEFLSWLEHSIQWVN